MALSLIEEHGAGLRLSAFWDRSGIYPSRMPLNRPRFPEAVSFESRRHSWSVQRGVVALLSLGRRDVADGLQQPAIVKPIDPFQRCELDGVERPPRPAPMDDLGFGRDR